MDITLEAGLEGSSNPETNLVVFQNSCCKWGIQKLEVSACRSQLEVN